MQTLQQFPSWFAKQKLSSKVAIGCVGFIVLCCMCSALAVILSPPSPSPDVTRTPIAGIVATTTVPTKAKTEISPTETIETTKSVAPTKTDVPTTVPSSTPKPTATQEPAALLPGLMPADVTVNLEQRGFACGSVEQGQMYYVRTCDKNTAEYSLHVEIYGRKPFSVDFIESTVLQFGTPNDDFAASFLGFMATMPYDGAVQQEARDWVESTLPTLKGQGDVREKEFAGVAYRLYGIPTAFTLEMGDLP